MNSLLTEKERFTSKQQAEAAQRIGNDYFCNAGMILGAIICLFEVLLLGRIMVVTGIDDTRRLYYSCCYLFLLVASIIAILVIHRWRDRRDAKRDRVIYCCQVGYIIAITFWSIAVTLLDAFYSGRFDLIVYMTIMLLTPIVSYINVETFMAIQGIADLAVLIAVFCTHKQEAALINFFVYAVTSLVACYMFQRTKRSLYLRMLELGDKAIHDGLTGLNNRQHLHDTADVIWAKAETEGRTVSVIMADIDDFKKINDKYGHLVGDRWLRNAADVLRSVCDVPEMTCYRYGGEEFVLILEGIGSEKAAEIAEKVRIEFAKKSIDDPDVKSATLSLGLVTGEPSAEKNPEHFLLRADELLYESKRSGKNRCTAAVIS